MANESRITSQVAEVLASGGKGRVTSLVAEIVATGGKARSTSQVAEVVVKGGKARSTSQVAEVPILIGSNEIRITYQYVEALVPYAIYEQLEAAITVNATVTAALRPYLKASINVTGVVTANLDETKEALIADINSSATVTADLLKNVFYRSASSTLTFTDAAINFNLSAGSLLQLTQNVAIEKILNKTIASSLVLTQSALPTGVTSRNVITVWGTLDHIASFKHVLPTKTASSTITFSSTAVSTRLANNVVIFNQSVVGVISFIPGIAANNLTLTHEALYDTTLYFTVNHTLQLKQETVSGHVTSNTTSNSLSFAQTAYGVKLNTGTTANNVDGHDCFVILQAPFNFLQTSIVLPCPIWGDTENVVSELSLKRSMNGGRVTYVKTNKNRRLTYTFRILDTPKAREVTEFFKYYNSDFIKLTNHKGEVWKVRLLTNPIDFVKTGRHSTDISLEFEGEKLYG